MIVASACREEQQFACVYGRALAIRSIGAAKIWVFAALCHWHAGLAWATAVKGRVGASFLYASLSFCLFVSLSLCGFKLEAVK